MRQYLIVLIVLCVTPLAAEEPGFTSKAAKDAQKSYERDVDKARKAYDDAVEAARKEYERQVSSAQTSYKAELIEAAKSSADKGDLDEVAKINAEVKRVEALGVEIDSVEALRKKVTGTRWTWQDGVRLTFKSGGIVEMSDGKEGRWEAVSDTEVFVKWKALWHFNFDFENRTCTSRPYAVSRELAPTVGRLIR